MRRFVCALFLIPLFAFVAPQMVLGQAEMTQDTRPVVNKSAKQGMMSAATDMPWQSIAPNSPIQVVTLWGDSTQGESGRLVKFPPGAVAPTHAHTGDYYGINLTGTWRHSFEGGEQRDLPPGSYVFQPGMAMHDDACVGPEACILFIHQHVKSDFIPKE